MSNKLENMKFAEIVEIVNNDYAVDYKIIAENTKDYDLRKNMTHNGKEIVVSRNTVSVYLNDDLHCEDGPAFYNYGKINDFYVDDTLRTPKFYLNGQRFIKDEYYKTCVFCKYFSTSRQDLFVHYDKEEERNKKIISNKLREYLNNDQNFKTNLAENYVLNIEEEFKATILSYKTQIMKLADQASAILEEAEKLANEHGIPFSSEVSRVSQTYTPRSFITKFEGVNIDVAEFIGNGVLPDEYGGGWEHSQIC